MAAPFAAAAAGAVVACLLFVGVVVLSVECIVVGILTASLREVSLACTLTLCCWLSLLLLFGQQERFNCFSFSFSCSVRAECAKIDRFWLLFTIVVVVFVVVPPINDSLAAVEAEEQALAATLSQALLLV